MCLHIQGCMCSIPGNLGGLTSLFPKDSFYLGIGILLNSLLVSGLWENSEARGDVQQAHESVKTEIRVRSDAIARLPQINEVRSIERLDIVF